MFTDKNGVVIKEGDSVRFTRLPNSPTPEDIPNFCGVLVTVPGHFGNSLVLLPPNKGVLVFEDDGEPCYELEKL